MINMNMSFEFMLMILKTHMFKADLNKNFKNVNKYIYIFLVVQRNKINFK
jgi:hypothetical protein